MNPLSKICLSIAIINSLLIALDSGQFYQTQLYHDRLSFLFLGFVTSLLIEAMVGLLFALAYQETEPRNKNFLLVLGGSILILSFASSSAKHVIPQIDKVTKFQNRKKLELVLHDELARRKDTENWLRQNNQTLNAIVHERDQKKLFDEYVKNIKEENSSFIPIVIAILIIILKFLMQITAAVFFAMSGHYSSMLSRFSGLTNPLNAQLRENTAPEETPREDIVQEETTMQESNPDLTALKKKAKLSNRKIAEALGVKESVVSNVMNKSNEIFNFLHEKINNSQTGVS